MIGQSTGGGRRWEIGEDGKFAERPEARSRKPNYYEALKRSIPEAQEQLRIVRDEKGVDHTKVEKIFELNKPHWRSKW